MIDYEGLFSNGQAITATANSTNVVDLGTTKDSGPGEEIPIEVKVTEDFATLTSLKVTVYTDDAEGMGTQVELMSSAAVPVASLVAGYKFRLRLPPHGLKRYLRLTYTVGGSNATTGKVFAGVVTGHAQSFQ